MDKSIVNSKDGSRYMARVLFNDFDMELYDEIMRKKVGIKGTPKRDSKLFLKNYL